MKVLLLACFLSFLAIAAEDDLTLPEAKFVCGARNAMGRYWHAIANSEAIAKAKALSICQEHSLFGCYSVGCHPAFEVPTDEYVD